MSEDKGFFKAGKGKFGKTQTIINENDIVLFRVPKNTSELTNGGSDGVNPYISAKDLVKGNGNSIVYGGVPTWISGYKFAVPDYGYIIRGKAFDTLAIERTLDDADPTIGQDREDLIVGSFDTDGNGVIEIVKGQTSNPAIKPTPNQETQIEITSIRVNGGTTQPADINNLVIYNENTEFTTSQTGGKADFDSPTLPFDGAKCINVVGFTTGDEIKFVNVGTFSPYDYVNYQFQIASTSGEWQNNGTLKIAFFNGVTKVSDWIIIDSNSPNKAGNPYSFNSAITDWQNIAIAITSFNFSANLADTIAIIKDDEKGAENFKLDLMRLQKGIVSPKPPLTKTKLSEFINDGNGDAAKPFITIDDVSSGYIQTVVGGNNITIDNTDPQNPIINSIASTYPPPYIDIVVPDSTLPSTTGNFELYGSNFKEDMTIVFAGQTVNYKIYHSSLHVTVNVTTGATEGLFSITLNNGISRTFPNAYMVVLGTVFTPLTAEWTNVVEPIDLTSDGKAQVKTFNSGGSAIWNKQFNYLINWSFRFMVKKTPLGFANPSYSFREIGLIKVSDSSLLFSTFFGFETPFQRSRVQNITEGFFNYSNALMQNVNIGSYASAQECFEQNFENSTYEYRCIAGIVYFYHNNILKYTYTSLALTENLKLKVNVGNIDVYNIKYIELA